LSIYYYQTRLYRFLPFMDSLSSSNREGEKAPGSPQAAGKHGVPCEGHSEKEEPKKNSRIERAWQEMEEQLARIPIDGDGLGVRSDDDPYTAEILLRTEDPGIDYGLWKFMDRDEIPRWTQRHRWRAEWEHREKLKELFQRWDTQSFELGLTYCCSELPKRFRFALKRPLMSVEDLGDILEELDLDLTFMEAYRFHTKRSKRARQLLLGIDPHETSHVSGYYRDMIQSPNALTEALDTYNPSVEEQTSKPPTEALDTNNPSVRQPKGNQQTSKPSTEALDIYNPSVRPPRQAKNDGQIEQQIRAACSVWGLFRAGEIEYTSALNQFRTILNEPEISDSDLAWRLEEFDIPMAGFLGEDDQFQRPGIAEPHEDEREIIQELSQCVKSYHTGAFTLDETLMFICDRLDGMVLDHEMFSDLLDEEGYTEYEIATHIWEWAIEELHQTSSKAAEAVYSPLVAGLSIEDLTADFVGKYKSTIMNGLDPGLALTEYREELGIEDFSPSQISYMLDQVRPGENDDMTDNRNDNLPPMGPPGRRRDTTEKERESSPKIRWQGAFSGTAGNPMDCDYENLSPSPEEGVSDSLFGLALPTKEAQRIGQKIGLPADFVRSRIRSSTPKRANVRKRRKLSISVTSPKKKRRHLGSETEIDEQSWFAKEGENQKTFVRNNFSKGSLLSRAVEKVLSEPCIESTRTEGAQSPSHFIPSSQSPKRLVLHAPKPIKLERFPTLEHPSSGQSTPSDSPPPSPLLWSTEPSPRLATPLSTCGPSPHLVPKKPPSNALDISLSPTDNDGPAKALTLPCRYKRLSVPPKRLNIPPKRLNVPPEGLWHGTTQDLQQWAFRKRKSIFVMLEILRKERKEKRRTPSANVTEDDSYFHNSSSNSGSSASTSALNKLFDKYRGML